MTEEQQPERNSEAYLVPALQKGLQILEMFSGKNKILTINDFVEQLGVSISYIYRTVITLTELNYLNKIERNNHELGPMFLSNSFIYLAFREIVEIATPYLLELRDESRVLS